ncbi:MAG: hypothetical protein CFH41_01552 [Alphaproteobacteria bacterium MarineAlpha11_Bin1]|nr:MAG: hypothetical protein CFH41_01552 [Alphaproteobacteria bacterium MarineAlpha11_Bin1]|tara:strand:+ start:5938 stop:6531 length:594 start_codon:yes stop_codon:yes gene_type:complete
MKQVVIFARRPQLGRVKTRLARDIGPVEALRFYRSNLTGVTRRVSFGMAWQTWLCLTPDNAIFDKRLHLPAVGRLCQGGGDLGERMERCFARFKHKPVLIVGSDIPDISRSHIAAAFDALRSNELVFGPSRDGGYWLVGIAPGTRVGKIFNNVRWSTNNALEDTLNNIGSCTNVGMLDKLIDIDDGAAYTEWRGQSS